MVTVALHVESSRLAACGLWSVILPAETRRWTKLTGRRRSFSSNEAPGVQRQPVVEPSTLLLYFKLRPFVLTTTTVPLRRVPTFGGRNGIQGVQLDSNEALLLWRLPSTEGEILLRMPFDALFRHFSTSPPCVLTHAVLLWPSLSRPKFCSP